MLTVTASGTSPQHLLARDLLPEAGALGRVRTGAAASRITNATCSIPGSTTVGPPARTRCARATEASWLACPWNSRRNCPSVAGAYTCPKPVHPTGTDPPLYRGRPSDNRGDLPGSRPRPPGAGVTVITGPGHDQPSPACSPTPSPEPDRHTKRDAHHRTPVPPSTTPAVVSLPVPSVRGPNQDFNYRFSATEGIPRSDRRPHPKQPGIHPPDRGWFARPPAPSVIQWCRHYHADAGLHA